MTLRLSSKECLSHIFPITSRAGIFNYYFKYNNEEYYIFIITNNIIDGSGKVKTSLFFQISSYYKKIYANTINNDTLIQFSPENILKTLPTLLTFL